MDIQELRKQPHLSVSSISEYIDCSQAYYFNRVRGLRDEYMADNLLLGSCIHTVLEQFHIAKGEGITEDIDVWLTLFEETWLSMVQNCEKPIRFSKGHTMESLLSLGKSLLHTYITNLPNDTFHVLATELAFQMRIPGVPIPIIGVFDLVEQDESGHIIITDFKTSSKAYSRTDIDKSLTVYYMAAKQYGYNDNEILLRFDCLIKTRQPKFEQYYTIRTEDDESRTIKKIQQVWDGIQKEVYIPNDTGWKCGYCAFKNQCDAWLLQKVI